MTQSVHCAATLAAGRPCRAWAMHGHALCRSHRDDELGPRGAGAPRAVCGGAACGNHLCLPVLPGGPGRHRCRQNRLTHGFYSRHFTPEERASRRSRALPAGSGRPRQRGQPCLRDCRWRPQAPRALGGGGVALRRVLAALESAQDVPSEEAPPAVCGVAGLRAEGPASSPRGNQLNLT
jgi:hypothetical protein